MPDNTNGVELIEYAAELYREINGGAKNGTDNIICTNTADNVN